MGDDQNSDDDGTRSRNDRGYALTSIAVVLANIIITQEQVHEKLEEFAKERQKKLVAALLKKVDSFVKQDVAAFKKIVDSDVEEKVAAPGGVALLGIIGYIYVQVAQQYKDSFLGMGSFFARVAEKGHRFKNNMSVLGSVVKLAHGTAKLQQKMEMEEMEKRKRWEREHPGEEYMGQYDDEEYMKTQESGKDGHTYETYDFESDENWKAYARNVEIPPGADEKSAMEKVRMKWYDKNIAPQRKPVDATQEDDNEAQEMRRREMEEKLMKDQDMVRVFDQGLKLMWKIGVMEAEEVARAVCQEICDTRSPLNKENPVDKETLKRRILGIHHIGEKYKAVAAKLKKGEKGAFTVQDFLDAEKKKADGTSPASPRQSPNTKNNNNNNNNNNAQPAAGADGGPPPRPTSPPKTTTTSTTPPPTATDDID